MARPIAQFAAIALLLGAVAAMAPRPVTEDATLYQDIGRRVPIPDCWDLACGRFLLAGVLEHLPTPSRPTWKTYAVLATAGAAVALGRFCVALGFSARSAQMAMWMTAFGSGSLYAIFDSYTSDALMYLLGPLVSLLMLRQERIRAGLAAGLGVFAKEFAVVPLWIWALRSALRRRWEETERALLPAMSATLLWLAVQAALMAIFNYTYGKNKSADLAHGGYLAVWISHVGAAAAARYLFTTFSAVYLLAPIGFARAPADLRALAIAAVPAAAAFVYVQQPERALWNFHFVVIPLAVVALEAVPAWLGWTFVACFALVNLRFGAQLPVLVVARPALVVTLAIASAAAWRAWTTPRLTPAVTAV